MFRGVDHIAIVVADTEQALAFYRDTLGFPVVASEVVNDPPVRLTHLDMGNVQLQLVQPVHDDHPLHAFLAEHGEGLHHICFTVDSVPDAIRALPNRDLPPRSTTPHNGVQGRQAAFIDPDHTRGLQFEITADADDT